MFTLPRTNLIAQGTARQRGSSMSGLPFLSAAHREQYAPPLPYQGAELCRDGDGNPSS